MDIQKIKGAEHDYRVRFTKFRLVYTLDDDNKAIFFDDADARGRIYKRLNRKK